VRTIARAEEILELLTLQNPIHVSPQFPIDETQFISLGLLLNFPLKMNKPLLFGSDPELIITSYLSQDLNFSVLVNPDFDLARSGLASSGSKE
jgi:hypothetical protein